MADMSKILDTIKQAILDNGQSRYAIARESGLSEAALSRLMSGKRGLSIDATEKLADTLDLDIIIRPRKGRRQGKR